MHAHRTPREGRIPPPSIRAPSPEELAEAVRGIAQSQAGRSLHPATNKRDKTLVNRFLRAPASERIDVSVGSDRGEAAVFGNQIVVERRGFSGLPRYTLYFGPEF